MVRKFEIKMVLAKNLHTFYYSLQNKLQSGSIESEMVKQSFDAFIFKTAQNVYTSVRGKISEKKKKNC